MNDHSRFPTIIPKAPIRAKALMAAECDAGCDKPFPTVNTDSGGKEFVQR